MQAYQLLARLNNLTLCGQDEEGNLEWIGNDKQWKDSTLEEEVYRIMIYE